VLKKTKRHPAQYNAVKSAASSALRSRAKKCSEVRCLRRWYQSGLERLAQQLWQIEPQLMQRALSPRGLYENLNLLTFNNMDHQRLRSLNKRYLADIYPESSVHFTTDHLRIEHDDSIWEIRIKGQNEIEIRNQILNATYNSTHSETVYFEPYAEEYRVGLPSHCNLYSQGSRPNYQKPKSIQHLSVGEIGLSYPDYRNHYKTMR